MIVWFVVVTIVAARNSGFLKHATTTTPRESRKPYIMRLQLLSKDQGVAIGNNMELANF